MGSDALLANDTFQQLYCLFVIEHGRRQILHCNVTRHPTADGMQQQLREAFPEAGRYRYLLLDRDTKFDADVIDFLKSTGLKPKRTSIQAPWENGISERWIGSCRRELLDHIIALNGIIEHRPGCKAKATANARVGGLHDRYFWRIAA